MKKFLFVIVILGCVDVTGVNEIIDRFLLAREVHSVSCPSVLLELAINETVSCSAFNEKGTRVEREGVSLVPTWESSDNQIVSVDNGGQIRAENTIGVATITACGSYNKCWPIDVTTF